MNSFVQADGQLLIAIQNLLVHDALTPIMRAITMLGEVGIFWIALCAVLTMFRKTRKLGLLAALSLLIGFLVCNVWLKPMIDRARPWELFEGVRRLAPDPGDASFPSGHTTSSFATAMAVYLNCVRCGFKRSYGVAALTLAGLIALSRLYLGMHFPSDVLGGIAIGIASAFIVYYVSLWNERRARYEVSD
ncbi:MAG: phosphatase PAP2 family protein [Firmicutes bacterium]|nr:phosphatase PAP2 family protein [Bacillota bacterium]